MARGNRSKPSRQARTRARPSPDESSGARTPAIPQARTIAPPARRTGRLELGGGAAALVGACAWTMSLPSAEAPSAFTLIAIYALAIVGAIGIAAGGMRLDRRIEQAVRPDRRRWIYGVLALAFGLIQAVLLIVVIPNRLPSAAMHLASVPVFTVVMAIGTIVGKRFGWWIAVVGGSIVLLSTILMIARILASAAFLAGVYGAFGQAAATFALVSVALIVEVVALLPICQVKFLMSRPGRRAYGV